MNETSLIDVKMTERRLTKLFCQTIPQSVMWVKQFSRDRGIIDEANARRGS